MRTLIRAGKGDHARRLLADQVAAHGESGRTQFLLAQLERAKGPLRRDAMLAAYEKGATFADAPARLFLDQGMALRELGQPGPARRAFQRYLELEPDSNEAAMVRYYLEQPESSP